MVKGAFKVSIVENKRSTIGWQVQNSFTIVSHRKDKVLLESPPLVGDSRGGGGVCPILRVPEG